MVTTTFYHRRIISNHPRTTTTLVKSTEYLPSLCLNYTVLVFHVLFSCCSVALNVSVILGFRSHFIINIAIYADIDVYIDIDIETVINISNNNNNSISGISSFSRSDRSTVISSVPYIGIIYYISLSNFSDVDETLVQAICVQSLSRMLT